MKNPYVSGIKETEILSSDDPNLAKETIDIENLVREPRLIKEITEMVDYPSILSLLKTVHLELQKSGASDLLKRSEGLLNDYDFDSATMGSTLRLQMAFMLCLQVIQNCPNLVLDSEIQNILYTLSQKSVDSDPKTSKSLFLFSWE